VVLALLVALAAGGVAGYLWYEFDEFRTATDRQLSRIRSDIRDLESRMDSLESDVGVVVGFGSLAGRVDSLESDLGNLPGLGSVEDRLGDLERSIDDLEFATFLQAGSIDDLAECVNAYMQTVGDSGGGRYTYYFC